MLTEFDPGGQAERTTYLVPSVVYVIEGALTVEIDGQAPVFNAGQTYAGAVNTENNVVNRSTAPAKFLVTFFGEERKPVLTRLSGTPVVGFRSTTVLQTAKTFTGEPVLFPLFAN